MINWKFDKEHSQLLFEARHLMIANVIGQFKDVEVNVMIADNNFEAAEFEMRAQTASLTTRNTIRDDHLKKQDFLDVKRYPVLNFNSKSIKKVNHSEYTLIGLLTIKGVEREISLKMEAGGLVKDSYSGAIKTGYSISGQIDRRDFGIDFSLPMEGGGLAVSHVIKIRAEIELVQVS